MAVGKSDDVLSDTMIDTQVDEVLDISSVDEDEDQKTVGVGRGCRLRAFSDWGPLGQAASSLT